MEIMSFPRQTGKSRTLIEIAAETTDSAIVVPFATDKRHLEQLIKNARLDVLVFTIDEVCKGELIDTDIHYLFLDDLDMITVSLFAKMGFIVKAGTYSPDKNYPVKSELLNAEAYENFIKDEYNRLGLSKS